MLEQGMMFAGGEGGLDQAFVTTVHPNSPTVVPLRTLLPALPFLGLVDMMLWP